jgi:uncharacterized MAPEG superfamily protein
VTVPLWCLLGFVLWTTLLLTAVGAARVAQILGGSARPSDFPSGVPHGGDRYWRLNRAHLNCLENLPLFGAVVLTGAVIGADAQLLDDLALTYLGARVAQSVVHVASGSDLAVQLRFGFFLVQLACLLWMLFLTVPAGAL